MNSLETSAIVLPGIVNYAMKHGVDIQKILRRHHVALDLENITQRSIDLKVLHAVIMEIETATQMPAVGLQIGEAFDWDYIPYIKTYIISVSNLREAFHAACHARNLVTPFLVLGLEEDDNDALLTLQTDVELSYEDERHYVEMVFSTLKTIFSRLLRKNFPMQSLHFCHSEHELLKYYEDFFGCSIQFTAPRNCMVFKRSILDVPLPGGSPEIHQQAKRMLDLQISDSPLQKGIAPKITQIMKNQTHLLSKNLESVAAILHMSIRTLQRRLDEEGVSFLALKDQIRYKLSRSALLSSEMSIEAISEELGYSDRHSFARAFKRWSGISPSAFRKKARSLPSG